MIFQQLDSPSESSNENHHLILLSNKRAVEALRAADYQLAHFILKQIQQSLQGQARSDPLIRKLQVVTFNNIACFYKKTNKPKSALIYLSKALKIQTEYNNQMSSLAQIYLNICAILSQLGKHSFAKEHIQIALQLIQMQIAKNPLHPDISNIQHIKLICCYNYAIELQHLREYEKCLQQLANGIETGQRVFPKNLIVRKMKKMREEVLSKTNKSPINSFPQVNNKYNRSKSYSLMKTGLRPAIRMKKAELPLI